MKKLNKLFILFLVGCLTFGLSSNALAQSTTSVSDHLVELKSKISDINLKLKEGQYSLAQTNALKIKRKTLAQAYTNLYISQVKYNGNVSPEQIVKDREIYLRDHKNKLKQGVPAEGKSVPQ